MKETDPIRAIESVPAGAWAVGVSGGADSVALLRLLVTRNDLRIHVAHLNHETRGQENELDAAFVMQLCRTHQVPCTVARISELDIGAGPRNPSARYRHARHQLFKHVMREHHLDGVVLAHHADDQAETVLLRLLRGAGTSGLAGMSVDSTVGGLRILRPLLSVRRHAIRGFLESMGQPWREDASNESGAYARNRVRAALARKAELVPLLRTVGDACRAVTDWFECRALPEQFRIEDLASMPLVAARASAGSWLRSRGCDAVDGAAIERLIAMCRDVATPAKAEFPGGVVVRRRGGEIFVDH